MDFVVIYCAQNLNIYKIFANGVLFWICMEHLLDLFAKKEQFIFLLKEYFN